MSRNQLCLSFSAAQVALAIFLWWYAPLQIVAAQEAAQAKYPSQQIQLGLDFFQRIEPAVAERASLALNFPAWVLSGPFSMVFPRPLYESRLRILSPKDLAFFSLTGILWYWLASKLIPRKTISDTRNLPRSVRITQPLCGLAFAVVVWAAGLDLLFSESSTIPYKQIGPFGLLWALGLTAYFVWNLRLEIKGRAGG